MSGQETDLALSSSLYGRIDLINRVMMAWAASSRTLSPLTPCSSSEYLPVHLRVIAYPCLVLIWCIRNLVARGSTLDSPNETKIHYERSISPNLDRPDDAIPLCFCMIDHCRHSMKFLHHCDGSSNLFKGLRKGMEC